ncbi:MAG: phage tail protein [bacterium]
MKIKNKKLYFKTGLTLVESLFVMVIMSTVLISSIPIFANKKILRTDTPNIGIVAIWANPGAIPSNFLECNGQAYNVADYPDLFNIIGTSYGGAGSTFNVPNLQGRTAIGAGTGAGLTNKVYQTTVGSEEESLTLAQLPNHVHIFNDPGHKHWDSGHAHGTSDPGHKHWDYGHSHTLWDGWHSHYYRDVYYSEFGSTPVPWDIGTNARSDYDNKGLEIRRNTNWTGSNIGIYNGYANVSYQSSNLAASTNNGNASIQSALSNVTVPVSGGSGTATGNPHENMLPFRALRYIIRAK